MRTEFPAPPTGTRKPRASFLVLSVHPHPTLLVGFDPRTALAVARSLHRQGIRVLVATVAPWETPIRSAAIEQFIPLPDAEVGSATFLSALLRLIKIHAVNTVLPITDRALVRLGPHASLLRACVRLAMAGRRPLATILNKSATARLAESLGVPVPRTRTVTHEHEIEPAAAALGFPLFVKARDKSRLCTGGQVPVQDARCCTSLEDFRRAVKAISGPLLAQSFIEGDDVGVILLLGDGEMLSGFQYRARRLHPAEGGVCVMAETEPLDTRLRDSALALLRALRWEGVAQLDFRQNPQTGAYALLEVNGRFWGSTAVAVRAGADFPFAVWQWLHGQRPAMGRYVTGLRARWLEGDLRRLASLLQSRRHGAGRLFREFATIAWDFRPGVRGMLWDWRDPVPALDLLRTLAGAWLRRRLRGVHTPVPGLHTVPGTAEVLALPRGTGARHPGRSRHRPSVAAP